MSWLLLFLAASGALVLSALWLLGVRWYYRLRTARPGVLEITCADGWRLAVHHRPAKTRRYREPVVLCHGVAANHLTFEFDPPHSIAHVLSEAGFDCYSVDLRGYGQSSRPPPGKRWLDVSIDDHILQDAPAALGLATKTAEAERAFWVGHSMGGLVGYGVCASEAREKLAGLVTIGSPAFFQYPKLLQLAIRIGAWGGRWAGIRPTLARLTFAPVLGYFQIPLGDIVFNPRHMSPRMMRQVVANLISSVTSGTLAQFREWILGNVFRSRDGKLDYREGLRAFGGPLLLIGGSEDRLAPPAAVEQAFALPQSQDKTLLIFGKDRGDREQYGHADLIFGTGAPSEVYVQVLQWLQARATPLDAPAPANELPAEGPAGRIAASTRPR